MKKIIFFFLTSVFILSVNAQQFNWAKSYAGMEGNSTSEFNTLNYSAYDSHGNVYILGTFGFGANIDDIRFIDNIGANGNFQAVVIAKLDPNGNLIWRKAIKNGNNINLCPNWLEVVGDTSVVMSTNMLLVASGRYLFYLDTLLIPHYPNIFPDYPFTNIESTSGVGTCFITFDLDGNVESQHFLQIKYIDSTGAEIGDYGKYVESLVKNGVISPFKIDKEGYIYMGVNLEKFWDGNVGYWNTSSFRLRIDDEREFDFDMNLNKNSKIFKFAPNFSDIIWERDLIVDTSGNGDNPYEFIPFISGISIDRDDNIYISGYIEHEKDMYVRNNDSTYFRNIFLDTNNLSHKLEIEPGAGYVGFMIKYDTSGNVLWENQLHGYTQFAGNENNPYIAGFGSQFYNSAINEENNSIYVIAEGYAGLGMDVDSYLIFNDTTTLTSSGNSMFIRYNKETGEYLSHGLASTSFMTGSVISYGFGTVYLSSKNNQVFALTIYNRDLIGVDTVFVPVNGYYGDGVALMRWKEDGELIDAINLPTNSTRDYLAPRGAIINNEGNLFLFGSFGSEMTFGNITIGAEEQSQVFMAKYSDPSFNQPYTGVGLNNIEIKEKNKITVYPNPTKGDVYITTQGEKINSFLLYNINGQLILKSEKLKTTNEKINLSAFSKGVYIIKIITNKNVYSRKVVKQ